MASLHSYSGSLILQTCSCACAGECEVVDDALVNSRSGRDGFVTYLACCTVTNTAPHLPTQPNLQGIQSPMKALEGGLSRGRDH
jgi:hypothetical protein